MKFPNKFAGLAKARRISAVLQALLGGATTTRAIVQETRKRDKDGGYRDALEDCLISVHLILQEEARDGVVIQVSKEWKTTSLTINRINHLNNYLQCNETHRQQNETHRQQN